MRKLLLAGGALLLGTSQALAWTPSSQPGLTSTVSAVKSSGGAVGIIHCANSNAATMFVQIFGAVPSAVTLGTTAPLFFVPIQAGSDGWANDIGMAVGTAISVAATTTATGSTAPSTAIDCTIGYQ